jgi:hypothetical protein
MHKPASKFAAAFLPLCMILIILSEIHVASSFSIRRVQPVHAHAHAPLSRTTALHHNSKHEGNGDHHNHSDDEIYTAITINRSTALSQMFSSLATVSAVLATSTATPSPAQAKTPSIKPDAAYQGLLNAREELTTFSQTFIQKSSKDFDAMKEFTESSASNMNNYEDNANCLLASKQLDAESKKEIGTIRRYGVGADVIIMWGGLKAELEEEEPSFVAVKKSLQRSMDSLDEVIAICKSNGF